MNNSAALPKGIILSKFISLQILKDGLFKSKEHSNESLG